MVVDENTGDFLDNAIPAALERADIRQSRQKKLISRLGEDYAIEDTIAPIRNENDEIVGTVLVFRDVTQQRKLSREMTSRATHDALTGLLNRGEFERNLTGLLQQAASEIASFVLFIDLDQFKLVNDTCGHAAGDQVLIQVGKLLTSLIRAGDSLARLGGDEFAVLLDRCPILNAQSLAQQICDQMEQFRFSYKKRRFRVGASIGLVPIDRRWGRCPGDHARRRCILLRRQGCRPQPRLCLVRNRRRHKTTQWRGAMGGPAGTGAGR